MDETTHTDTTQQQPLDACVASWPRLEGDIAYNHLVDYHTYNTYGAYNLSAEEWDNREMIYNFKNNSELTDPISHLNAMNKAIELFTALLRDSFGDLLPQLKAEHRWKQDDFTAGLWLLLCGFFRNCVVADQCGIYVNAVFSHMESANALAVAGAGALFCIQMYCDFAGYSEIAAGCARLMELTAG